MISIDAAGGPTAREISIIGLSTTVDLCTTVDPGSIGCLP